MNPRIAISLALVTGTLLAGYAGSEVVRRAVNTATYSDSALLVYTWDDYKRRDWNRQTGQVVDWQTRMTTSEGQSYALLRAVWIGDRKGFELTWRWTREALQHSDDHLFSWLFGSRADGTSGVIYQKGGGTSATDADTDIALALILAYSRWRDQTYLDQAQEIINDIWRYEVVEIQGSPYILADNLEWNARQFLVINPSYFEPYAYRLFALLDKQHNWLAVVRSGYRLLAQILDTPLNTAKSAGLPPDSIILDRVNAKVTASSDPRQSTDFGFDAFRTPWRLAVDWKWNGCVEARSALHRMSVLSSFWNQNHKLAATYTHDGSPRVFWESSAMYGATLGYFLVADPPAANEIYKTRIEGKFHRSTRSWRTGYYDENWLWFGTALKQGYVRDFEAASLLQQL